MPESTCSTPGCQKALRSPGSEQCDPCYQRAYRRRKNPLLQRDCEQCGEVFVPKRHGVKFCSGDCRYRYGKIAEARRIKERRAIGRVLDCIRCGTDITHRRNDAKFCSLDCSNAWDREHRQERIRSQRAAFIAANPGCQGEWTKRYAAKNPEQYAVNQIAYRIRHRERLREMSRAAAKRNDPDGMKARLREQNRRARKLGNPESVGISPRDWKRMVRIYRGRCAYCGEQAEKLTLDHVIPIAKGGRHAIGNAVPACGFCNSSKHAKLLAVWRYKYLPLVKEIAA